MKQCPVKANIQSIEDMQEVSSLIPCGPRSSGAAAEMRSPLPLTAYSDAFRGLSQRLFDVHLLRSERSMEPSEPDAEEESTTN
jgi:hypothetical protein